MLSSALAELEKVGEGGPQKQSWASKLAENAPWSEVTKTVQPLFNEVFAKSLKVAFTKALGVIDACIAGALT